MVSFVVVSHSEKLAEGVVELARQMAPTVTMIPAGGMADGGIGTDVEKITAALQQAMNPDGVIVLVDLGGAIMTTEIAMENCEGDIRIGNGPIAEGAVVGAVQAGIGMSIEEVLECIEDARKLPKKS